MVRILPAIAMILSGCIIPLPFFPDWLQPVLKILPFSGILDIPFRLYLGLVPADQIILVISLQAIWIAAFIGIGWTLLTASIKRVTLQGG